MKAPLKTQEGQLVSVVLTPHRSAEESVTSSPTLADLYFMTGLVLPQTPAYHLTVDVQRDGSVYRLTDINAVLGSTDLAGNLTVDAPSKVPAIAGKVASRSLNFADLGPLVGGGKAQAPASKYLLPDTPLHTERLKQTNAEVDYSAASISHATGDITVIDLRAQRRHCHYQCSYQSDSHRLPPGNFSSYTPTNVVYRATLLSYYAKSISRC